MVFASLLAVGLSTLVQVRRLGPLGAGAVMPFFTAAFAIPFCITAVVDGGPATLTTLVLASAAFQFVVARWLFILRRLVTPVVSGTVMMILSITLGVGRIRAPRRRVDRGAGGRAADGVGDANGRHCAHDAGQRTVAPVGRR